MALSLHRSNVRHYSIFDAGMMMFRIIIWPKCRVRPTQIAYTAIITGALTSVSIAPAFAHFGHFGDLAGHSHWAGIALAGAAVTLGGLLVKGKNRSQDLNPKGQTEQTDTGDLQQDGSTDETGDEVHA